MQQCRRGSDGVPREDQLPDATRAQPGNESPRQALGTADGAIATRLYVRFGDYIADQMLRHLGGLAERMPGVQSGDIGGRDRRFLAVFPFEPVDRRRALVAIHPQEQAERPHVAAEVGFAG